jgi:DNA repair protein RadC
MTIRQPVLNGWPSEPREEADLDLSPGRLGPTRIRDLPAGEQPRERLIRYGAGALATAELLAILLRTGLRGSSVLDMAQHIVARFGLAGLARASVAELCQVPGCGEAKAVEIQAAIELGRRLVAQTPDDPPQVTCPADAAALLTPQMGLLEQEHLRVILLNMKNYVLGIHEVYKGSVSASPVRIGEVFREAIRRNGSAMVVAHNHPSGDPTPSTDDIFITRELVQAGELLDVTVLDHVVIARRGWVSMRERGLVRFGNRW